MSPLPRTFVSAPCRATSKALTAVALAFTTMLTGCPEDKVVVKNLLLEVTSEAPATGKVERLRVLFEKDGERFPAKADSEGFNLDLAARNLDPVAGPVLLEVDYNGASFAGGGNVTVNVTGWSGSAPVVRFEGQVDLANAVVLKVRLLALPSGCDADGDGFLDCSVAGCCAQGTVFGDCGGNDATTNPWVVEATCKPCSDKVDHDCSGGDAPCVDADNDQIADCEESAACGLGDPTSGPGKPEICDGKDNNCKGGADEGLTLSYDGKVLDKGDACGLGACAGGTIECDGTGGMRCSNDNKRKSVEDCATVEDDNCNGVANEGCVAEDFDGDGSLTPADCNDFDAGVFPGRLGEPCCATSAQGNAAAEKACDKNCDGNVSFCEGGDSDGDGVTVAEGDCNDNDPNVAPGKPEKCGDGIDQDCAGGDLACIGLIDVDGDGWPTGVDCNDDDKEIGPGHVELCNGKDDDCDLMVDEGNPGGGAQCGSTDVGDCSFGAEQCRNSQGTVGELVCVGAIEPKSSDICDGHDEDCDGETDEDFSYLGLAIGAACDGVGGCGTGVVECAPGLTDLATCSTNPNGSRSEASVEVCDAVDNDCDGAMNEGLNDVADSTCANLGVCAAHRDAIVATCTAAGTWDCNYAAVPGYEAGVETSCDDLDNDCDGSVNEDFTFTQPDGTVRGFGVGCDGSDSDECNNGLVVCKPGSTSETTCAETGGPREELCDGLDNDCDGETDEDFRDTAANRVALGDALATGDNGKFLGDTCGEGACAGGVVVCGSTLTLKCNSDPRTPASPGAPVDICDGIDNDCDGGVDESYLVGGSVKVSGALLAADNGKVKGATCGAGECAGGTVVCATTTTLGCSTDANGQTSSGGTTVTKTDICNGKDDNCNGTIDDDFVATTGNNRKPLAGALFAGDNGKIKGATCGIGECLKDSTSGGAAPGTVVCNAAGTALTCSSDVRAKTDTCDNLDNDCDGTDDDPFRAGGGTTLQGAKFAADNGKVKGATCGTGTCAAGKVACAANKSALVCDSDVKAVNEVCDAIDNDCDGNRDEDFKYLNLAMDAACDGTGACGAGTVVCAVGVTDAATCSTNPNGPASQVTAETCDGLDNNCDELVDEGFAYNGVSLGGGCSGVGACGSGTVQCSTVDPSRATCSTLSDGSASQATTEICDTLDNNCDGNVNEGFTYEGALIGATCDGVGACGAGIVQCAGTTTITCSTNPNGAASGATAELCDNVDNDCNGVIDNGFTIIDATSATRSVGQSCDGVGECAIGVVECASTATARCSTNPSGSAPGNVTETCDAKDNDCNGVTDNGFTIVDATSATRSVGQSCDGVGECAIGTVECATTATARCSTNPGGSIHGDVAETCDNKDNDCDSLTDATDPSLVRDLCQNQNGACAGARKPVSFCVSGSWTGICGDTEYEANNGPDFGPEVCDAKDNDCDSFTDTTDNNLVIPNCENQSGVCLGTTKPTSLCVTGRWGDCVAATYLAQRPTYGTDLCDALDNNCDSFTDEQFKLGGTINYDDELYSTDTNLVLADECGVGECEGGTIICDPVDATKMTLSCSTVAGHRRTPEHCDDADDDCDGQTDEIFTTLTTAYDPHDVGKAKGDACGSGVCDPSNMGAVECNVAETALVCSTDLTPPSTTEICDALDNDCDGDVDETFANVDNDAFADCVDTCIDKDNDGWGIAGANSGCIGLKAGVTDCDDALGNSNDADGDNVCINKGAACATGQTTGCSDNCPSNANNTIGNVQLDSDRDGLGDTCDVACAFGKAPYEICGDCIDNDCDGTVDETSDCVQAKKLTISAGIDGAPINYAVAMAFDHAGLVGSGVSTATGDDVRIFYQSPTAACSDSNSALCYTEIDRVLDPSNGSTWNSAATKVWFPLSAAIAASGSDGNYIMYFGTTDGGVLHEEADVFYYADFFGRTGADSGNNVGNGWVETEPAADDVKITTGALDFAGADDGLIETPRAQVPFTTIASGRWKWVTGFNLAYGSGSTYQVMLQLGNNALMSAATSLDGVRATYPYEGVGPSIVWSSNTVHTALLSNAKLGVQTLDVSTDPDTAVFSPIANTIGWVDIDVELAMTAGAGGDNYNISVPGGSNGPIAFGGVGVESLDRIRIITDDLSTSNADPRRIEYVYLRPYLGSSTKEPSVTIGALATGASCTLSATNLIARYPLSEGTGSAIGDTATTPHNLTVGETTAKGVLATIANFGFGALHFTTVVSETRAQSTTDFTNSANKFVTSGLNGSTAATMELVFYGTDSRVAESTASFIAALTNKNGDNRFSAAMLSSSVLQVTVGNIASAANNPTLTQWKFPLVLATAKRTVAHVVFDSANATAADRLRLYVDGVRVTPTTSPTVTQNNVLRLVGTGGEDTGRVVIGNDHSNTPTSNSFVGRVFYVAFYNTAMSAATLLKNAQILDRTDD